MISLPNDVYSQCKCKAKTVINNNNKCVFISNIVKKTNQHKNRQDDVIEYIINII